MLRDVAPISKYLSGIGGSNALGLKWREANCKLACDYLVARFPNFYVHTVPKMILRTCPVEGKIRFTCHQVRMKRGAGMCEEAGDDGDASSDDDDAWIDLKQQIEKRRKEFISDEEKRKVSRLCEY